MELQITLQSSNLVILADSHNPSLLTDSFLMKSEIIGENDEIDRDSYVLTPALTNVVLKKDNDLVNITLDPGMLKISGAGSSTAPFQVGKLYCRNLPHIVGKAFGINLDFLVKGLNANKWFDSKNHIHFKDSRLTQLIYQFLIDKGIANVTIANHDSNSISVKFNFHYDLNKQVLGDLNDFVSLRNSNQNTASEFLNKTFNE